MNYYNKYLHGENLEKCYSLAPLRVKRYLLEEINHVLSRLKSEQSVLELGCGYGRILFQLADHVTSITGIDVSKHNIEYAMKLNRKKNCSCQVMNAMALAFKNNMFDRVLCL
ncbi:MAG: class I SAM-dependent methyltransferase [Proteobacteria bacterium]|nr:class I SAM-dependent methyltransferase [Pseudomonadota bacterium]